MTRSGLTAFLGPMIATRHYSEAVLDPFLVPFMCMLDFRDSTNHAMYWSSSTLRRVLLFAIAILFGYSRSNAQQADTLFLATDSLVLGKVLEVGVEEVKYKRADNPDGPTYSIRKSQLRRVVYSNGVRDVFPQTEIPANTAKGDLRFRGETDAMIHYKSACGAGSTFWMSFLCTPIIGLIPAVGCSSTKPRDANLNYTDHGLMQIPEYRAGYTQEAFRMKKKRIWVAWGFGFLGLIPAALLISEQR